VWDCITYSTFQTPSNSVTYLLNPSQSQDQIMSIKENDPNTIYKQKQWDVSFWDTKYQSAL